MSAICGFKPTSGRTKGRDSIARTRWTKRRGSSSRTYDADNTREEGVSGAPNDKRVESGVSLGGSDLKVPMRLASSGDVGGGVRVCNSRR